MIVTGTLTNVDQYLNIRLADIQVSDQITYPHMISVKNCFIRGSAIRYISIAPESIDTPLLQEASRRALITTNSK
ncbi:U6 snRNA-associated Sm-like protein LSm2 [Mitosporidium daphniae]|uniref:U6 snRNA-associated Sm-like protein LSm2 n=1 Tax=Mitosporidium daphniae TaxID=1485682 RepID=A0A098VXE4_9MICR|nr:U6 snRNA-associated Sm-like protein LSm2 [Mitosporidium daphniae]KGG52386.1 U6 snRNA-associated Sm-like protein LSm2 [Mitosporidium daphniae]|eukprot:XP_013238813.1 U6 snRNA-associated Sm-like protein LSm2 [Mitosporidium daphniae]